jgi:hypothetical protein
MGCLRWASQANQTLKKVRFLRFRSRKGCRTLASSPSREGANKRERKRFSRKCGACSKSHKQRKQNTCCLTRRHLAPLSHLQMLQLSPGTFPFPFSPASFAIRLRSSVVSVLFSLIAEMVPTGPKYSISLLFGTRLKPLPCSLGVVTASCLRLYTAAL